MQQPESNSKTRKTERGTVSVVSAFAMVVMLLGAGLAVDVSHMYLAGGELQNAADAAAIAGASRLNGFPSGITSAVDKAVALQNRYEFGANVATLNRWNVRFGRNLSDLSSDDDDYDWGYSETQARMMADQIRFIRVRIPYKSITVPFASLALGTNQVSLSRRAVAGFSAGLQTLCNSIVPLSVVQDDVTHQPLQLVGSCSNTWAFTPGCTYVIRGGSNGNNNEFGSVSPGNYNILAIGLDKGGADARLAIAGNPFGCYKPGDEVQTEPGVTASSVRFGLNTRFGEYHGGMSSTDFPPDLNIKTGITYEQYRSEASQYWQSPSVPGREGRRIIIIPIVNISEYDQGRNTVKIYKFAAFFMKEKVANGNGGDITAEYISTKVQVADGTFSSGTGTETQFSVPVLYK